MFCCILPLDRFFFILDVYITKERKQKMSQILVINNSESIIRLFIEYI